MTFHGAVLFCSRVLLVVGLVAITWVSLEPADRLPPSPNVSDKVLHFAAYALLGAIAALAQRKPRVILTVVLLTGFGLLLEFLQGRTSYRAFEMRDLLADALGAAFGALLVAVLVRALSSTRRRTGATLEG